MLKKFFLLCSGIDQNVIQTCSNGEQNKYAGIGATVFFTAIMAFLAGSFALFTVFDNAFIALGFGFVWGLLIFNLDRSIIVSIKKTGKWKEELNQAWLRIILAVFIGIVIATPLELKLFEDEINAKVEENLKNQFP